MAWPRHQCEMVRPASCKDPYQIITPRRAENRWVAPVGPLPTWQGHEEGMQACGRPQGIVAETKHPEAHISRTTSKSEILGMFSGTSGLASASGGQAVLLSFTGCKIQTEHKKACAAADTGLPTTAAEPHTHTRTLQGSLQKPSQKTSKKSLGETSVEEQPRSRTLLHRRSLQESHRFPEPSVQMSQQEAHVCASLGGASWLMCILILTGPQTQAMLRAHTK